MSSGALSEQQFAMVPIGIVKHWRSGDSRGERGSVHSTLSGKRNDPQYAALRDDIAKNGMSNPVFASSFARPGPVVDDGHHRIAAAAELGHTHVPVVTEWLKHEEYNRV